MKLYKVETTQYLTRSYLVNAETPEKAAETVMLANVDPSAEGTLGEVIEAIREIVPTLVEGQAA